jgi:hypothetical protein
VKPLRLLADSTPVAIAGAGATSTLAEQTGARRITMDPVTAAEHLHGERGPDHPAGGADT